MIVVRNLYYLVLGVMAFGCNPKPKQVNNLNAFRPKVVIYKTNKPSADLVPVQIIDKAIISYPAPQNLLNLPNFGSPIALKQGYYLDLNGISANTKFLAMTRSNYSKLDFAPTIEEMNKSIREDIKFVKFWEGPEIDAAKQTQAWGDSIIADWDH
jgi:hypothetical protein